MQTWKSDSIRYIFDCLAMSDVLNNFDCGFS